MAQNCRNGKPISFGIVMPNLYNIHVFTIFQFNSSVVCTRILYDSRKYSHIREKKMVKCEGTVGEYFKCLCIKRTYHTKYTVTYLKFVQLLYYNYYLISWQCTALEWY